MQLNQLHFQAQLATSLAPHKTKQSIKNPQDQILFSGRNKDSRPHGKTNSNKGRFGKLGLFTAAFALLASACGGTSSNYGNDPSTTETTAPQEVQVVNQPTTAFVGTCNAETKNGVVVRIDPEFRQTLIEDCEGTEIVNLYQDGLYDINSDSINIPGDNIAALELASTLNMTGDDLYFEFDPDGSGPESNQAVSIIDGKLTVTDALPDGQSNPFSDGPGLMIVGSCVTPVQETIEDEVTEEPLEEAANENTTEVTEAAEDKESGEEIILPPGFMVEADRYTGVIEDCNGDLIAHVRNNGHFRIEEGVNHPLIDQIRDSIVTRQVEDGVNSKFFVDHDGKPETPRVEVRIIDNKVTTSEIIEDSDALEALRQAQAEAAQAEEEARIEAELEAERNREIEILETEE